MENAKTTQHKRVSRKKMARLREKKFQSITSRQLGRTHTMTDLMRILDLSTTNSAHRKYVEKLIREKRILAYPTGEKKGVAIVYDFCFPASDLRSQESLTTVSTKKTASANFAEKMTKAVSTVAEKITTKITISCNSVNITLENPTPEVVEAVLSKVPLQN